MRLARIRSSNPAQVAKLRDELRSVGYVVESLGLSAASPWKADLELLVEATRQGDGDDPEYRIFLSTERFGPVYRNVAEALERVDSAVPLAFERSQAGLSRARFAVLTFSAAIILIVLVLGFLMWHSAPANAPGIGGEAQSLVTGSPWAGERTARRNAAQHDRSTELAPKAISRKVHRRVYSEPEVVVTHFATGAQQGSSSVSKFTDLK